ncbi:MAG TPA: DNA cytosine methyltransferase [Candidatus Hydrogenedentes bacterium]|nr:DNA cytosine methyltransferase [Candidatus Hydrogenedentota bacterium]
MRSAEQYCEAQQVRSPRTHAKKQRSTLETKAGEGREKYSARPSPADSSVSKPRKFTVVSMFSGCGGMDLGFKGGFEIFGRRYRSLPFEVVWANDLNDEACKTYERNLGYGIHRGDIWTLIDKLPKCADVLVGGFPCQDISVNGKREGVNGKRSGLYRAMIEAIRRVRPSIFVAENVKALLRHQEWLKQVLNDFGELGYDLNYHLYQAADYGVPQTRERVFFVGTAPGMPKFIPPKPERNAATWISAKEAIGDLEDLSRLPGINHIWSEANISPEQGNRRLIAGRPGYTIRAECHGNIQFHYSLPRRISMREAARIQSFPDKFTFVSGLREVERQVGNAVPPVLAWHVARSVLDCLE